MNAKTTTLLRRVLNYVLYLLFCFLIGTGLMLDYKLPHGRDARGITLWGMDRHEWGDWHTWVGYIFAVLIIIHLWLARKWLVSIAVKRHATYLYAGLALGLLLVAGLLLTPTSGGMH